MWCSSNIDFNILIYLHMFTQHVLLFCLKVGLFLWGAFLDRFCLDFVTTIRQMCSKVQPFWGIWHSLCLLNVIIYIAPAVTRDCHTKLSIRGCVLSGAWFEVFRGISSRKWNVWGNLSKIITFHLRFLLMHFMWPTQNWFFGWLLFMSEHSTRQSKF